MFLNDKGTFRLICETLSSYFSSGICLNENTIHTHSDFPPFILIGSWQEVNKTFSGIQEQSETYFPVAIGVFYVLPPNTFYYVVS